MNIFKSPSSIITQGILSALDGHYQAAQERGCTLVWRRGVGAAQLWRVWISAAGVRS